MEIIVALIVICAILLFILDYRWKPKLPFPSPFPRIPLIGHALFLRKYPHKKLTSWAKELGPVYVIQVLQDSFLILNDNKSINEVIHNKNEDFAAKPVSFRGGYLTGGKHGKPKSIFFQDTDAAWTKMKAYTSKQISDTLNSQEYAIIATEVSKDMIQLIRAQAKDGILDPFDAVSAAVSCNFYSMIFGKKQSIDDPTLKKLREIEPSVRAGVSTEGRELETFPWLRFFGHKIIKIFNYSHELNRQLFDLVKAKAMENKTGIGPAFVGGKDGLDIDDEIRAILLGIDCFNAGLTPPASAVYGSFMLMATHERIQDKLYKEIASFAKAQGKEFICPRDQQYLPYTEACVHELLRCFTIVPLFNRRALRDTSVQGIAIPKDTNVFVNNWAHHHDENIWENPWEFDPDRFLDSSGKVLPPSDPLRLKLVQQGEGMRKCLGWKSSDAIIFTLLANIIHSFEIGSVGGIDIPSDPRQWDQFIFAFEPGRCQLRFTERQ